MKSNDRRINFNAKRTVVTRRSKYNALSIIAVDMKAETIWTESDDRIRPLAQLPVEVLREPNAILAGWEIGLAVKEIADVFEDDETFQIRAAPIERDLAPWSIADGTTSIVNGIPVQHRKLEKRSVMYGLAFTFLGWKETKNERSRWYRRHFPVDPALFTSSFKPEYRSKIKNLEAVIEWTRMVREFLTDNDLEFRATQSGIAAQLLRDKRFYPEARRKVPRATNLAARDPLPGNFYFHSAHNRLVYSALEIDQKNSHHTCAASLRFPCANRLYAKGYFRTLQDRPYAYKGTKLFNRLIADAGLFLIKIKVPARGGNVDTTFLLPCAQVNGERLAYVFSNELDDLRDSGVEILYIVACWTSKEIDNGLNKFASWSLGELAKSNPERRRWLKPLLLSAYGLLATKARPMRSAYFRGEGETVYYHVGRGEVMKFSKYESARPFEPGFVNVIHRGMIEAETRLRSLRMARYLFEHGFTVLVIYADAVYVTGERELPILPPHWGTREITGAHFPNANRVVCDQYVKLPGVAGKKRETLVDEIRGVIA